MESFKKTLESDYVCVLLESFLWLSTSLIVKSKLCLHRLDLRGLASFCFCTTACLLTRFQPYMPICVPQRGQPGLASGLLYLFFLSKRICSDHCGVYSIVIPLMPNISSTKRFSWILSYALLHSSNLLITHLLVNILEDLSLSEIISFSYISFLSSWLLYLRSMIGGSMAVYCFFF